MPKVVSKLKCDFHHIGHPSMSQLAFLDKRYYFLNQKRLKIFIDTDVILFATNILTGVFKALK
jgi:hypothetical protein